jgi:hypothetical protein
MHARRFQARSYDGHHGAGEVGVIEVLQSIGLWD